VVFELYECCSLFSSVGCSVIQCVAVRPHVRHPPECPERRVHIACCVAACLAGVFATRNKSY